MTQNRTNAKLDVVQFVTNATASRVVSTGNIPTDDTIPQSSEGTEIITCAITPVFNDSTLEIVYTGWGTFSSSTSVACCALFQDSGANAICATAHKNAGTTDDGNFWILRHFMTSGTTSATTFKIRIGATSVQFYTNGDSSTRIMGGVGFARLSITEYK